MTRSLPFAEESRGLRGCNGLADAGADGLCDLYRGEAANSEAAGTFVKESQIRTLSDPDAFMRPQQQVAEEM